MTYKLYATREGRLWERPCALNATTEVAAMAEAKDIVEQREEAGSWPEGADALLRSPEGRLWMFTDEWEPIDDDALSMEDE